MNEGHNSEVVTAAHLRQFIERVERLNDEIRGLNTDKSEVFSEAKSNGFDVKIMKEIIRLRKMDPDERREREAILDLYRSALND